MPISQIRPIIKTITSRKWLANTRLILISPPLTKFKRLYSTMKNNMYQFLTIMKKVKFTEKQIKSKKKISEEIPMLKEKVEKRKRVSIIQISKNSNTSIVLMIWNRNVKFKSGSMRIRTWMRRH